MALVRVPYRTFACDYHAFGALAALPNLGFFATVTITSAKMSFRTQMAFLCALFRTVAYDYYACGAFVAHPGLIL